MSRSTKQATGLELAEGVYEHLVTEALATRLQGTAPLIADYEALDDADAHIALARHVGREIERALDGLPKKDRVEKAREFVGVLLEHLASLPDADSAAIREQLVSPPARRLTALFRSSAPQRPKTPLTTSSLLTRSRGEPPLGHELAREIETSDHVDAIIAFVTVSGVNAIREALHEFTRRGGRFRLLTTTFRGVTELAALDELARLPGAEVKVSFDTRRTRLHAKAWLFHRRSDLNTAYIGSANLTSTALGAGHEWMVKVCTGDLPHVIQQFQGTFDTLWADAEFEAYRADDEATRDRLSRALAQEQGGGVDERGLFLVALRALPFQEEILDKLQTERVLHGRRRNLVVAATGTGKTVIAALDYVRRVGETGVAPRLLFLAHRRELLEQARTTFRHALQDRSFGELLVDGDVPEKWDHVFASIQSAAARDLIERFGADHFKHVVVDECHHMPAKTYQDVVPRLAPDILVGLTATPERADGKSLLPDFDSHIAAELRLWNALDGQLLVPFEYFGLSDGVDLRRVRWTRQGYDAEELAQLYTGNTARADLVLKQLRQRVAAVRRVRALGFCVSIEHARFMASRFTELGVPALAVYGNSAERDDAQRKLREREVNVLFVCDLYNEGVDMPFVDTLLLLRPTQSATLFLQQLGRGLRLDIGKESCLVLDFIGQHRSEFRFDGILSAVTGIPRAAIRKAVEEGFPYLPSGCTLHLDRVARETILHSLKTALAGAKQLTKELRELTAVDGARPRLASFLEQTGRDLDDVYEAGGWSTLLEKAGALTIAGDEAREAVAEGSKRLGWLRHIDEPERLRRYDELLQAAIAAQQPALSTQDRARMLMFDAQVQFRGVLRAAEASLAEVAKTPALVQEFTELREVLEDKVALVEQRMPVPEWPLALHRHYSRREILAAVGFMQAGEKLIAHQGGILKLDGKRELLFVTLDKSSKDYSPSTRYRDYAISPDEFHWETQGAASVTRESGKRYIESPRNGNAFFLFVRMQPGDAFAFLGPVTYEKHEGDRPIGITWRLQYPMPAALYGPYAKLRPG